MLQLLALPVKTKLAQGGECEKYFLRLKNIIGDGGSTAAAAEVLHRGSIVDDHDVP